MINLAKVIKFNMESTGTIDELLCSPSITLEDILGDDEFEVELNNKNDKLIKL